MSAAPHPEERRKHAAHVSSLALHMRKRGDKLTLSSVPKTGITQDTLAGFAKPWNRLSTPVRREKAPNLLPENMGGQQYGLYLITQLVLTAALRQYGFMRLMVPPYYFISAVLRGAKISASQVPSISTGVVTS